MRPLPTHVDVLVVGCGFGGIAAAIRLGEAGRTVAVIEKAGDVGGTWQANTYPACACDVPSHLYSFSFAPNPEWTRVFGPQPELYAYLRKVADDYGVRDKTWFGTEVTEASWDAAHARWQVETTAGPITANVLVAATGGLSSPALPDVPGLESFAGKSFHSAAWDHDHDFTGERVAVIGTGASAIQFAPEVARQAGQLAVFQRTAPWIMPRRDRAIRPIERALFRRFPALQKLARGGIYAVRESWVLGFRSPKVMEGRPEKIARHFIQSQITDPELRAKVTPTYRLGCKRVLLSNTWYRMLGKPHVSLVTDRIVEVIPEGVVTTDADGVRRTHEVDTIVFGTGFNVTNPPIAHRLRGAAGRTLAEHWADTGMAAYRGLTVAGFPNLFVLTGPNTGLGHTSVVFIIERQVEHLVKAVRAMEQAGVRAIDVRPDVEERYSAGVQRALSRTVWNAGGCSSWYLDAQGRNTILWPTYTFAFKKELATFSLADYQQA
jgi:cation diffusion facilitator CzcD-associated flavoprotein CzcO